MRRVHGHFAFALVAVTLGTIAIGATVRLEHAERINAEVAQWSEAAPKIANAVVEPTVETAGLANTTAKPTAPADPKWIAGAADNLSPEGRLTRAEALSKYDYDAALAAYKAIIQSTREDLRKIALYDLGNLHLHQAIKAGVADESQSLPLTELAKQSYRDLLRTDPTDWDARYNLERALRLAPEDEDDEDADTGPPDPREHERSTIADPRMDLP